MILSSVECVLSLLFSEDWDSLSFVSFSLAAVVAFGTYHTSVPTLSTGFPSLYIPVSEEILELIFFTISLGT